MCCFDYVPVRYYVLCRSCLFSAVQVFQTFVGSASSSSCSLLLLQFQFLSFSLGCLIHSFPASQGLALALKLLVAACGLSDVEGVGQNCLGQGGGVFFLVCEDFGGFDNSFPACVFLSFFLFFFK